MICLPIQASHELFSCCPKALLFDWVSTLLFTLALPTCPPCAHLPNSLPPRLPTSLLTSLPSRTVVPLQSGRQRGGQCWNFRCDLVGNLRIHTGYVCTYVLVAVADTCALEHLRHPAGTPFRSVDPDFFEHTRHLIRLRLEGKKRIRAISFIFYLQSSLRLRLNMLRKEHRCIS